MADTLIKLLEAAEEGSPELDDKIWHMANEKKWFGKGWKYDLEFADHYTTSLDAALTLLDKDVDWDIFYDPTCAKPYTVTLDGLSQTSIEVDAPTAALAVCLGWAYSIKARKAVG